LEFQTKQLYREATAQCFSAGTEIKTERGVGILATEVKESGEPGQKRRKTYVKQEERITKIMEEYGTSDDLCKCLKALNYKNKRG